MRKGFWIPSRRLAQRVFLIVLLLIMSLVGGAFGARISSGALITTTGASVKLSSSVTDLQQAVENVPQTVQRSVVVITGTGSNGEATGSGIILTSDGYIATNDHVVRGYASLTVTLSSGGAIPATLIGEAPQEDIAALKIAAANLRPIVFVDSSKVAVGQYVVAIGAPLGLANTVTTGIVSARGRTAGEAPGGPADELTGLIQTNAAINQGNSGGALVDLQGRLVGMPTLGITRASDGTDVDGIGFAISANRIATVTSQLI